MVDKTLQMALLFDAYGSLLTEKQQEFVSLYYNDDLSLGEIAANYNISRQAVYDILKRSESALNEFEERLGIVAREEAILARTPEIQAALTDLYAMLAESEPALHDRAERSLSILKAALLEAYPNLT